MDAEMVEFDDRRWVMTDEGLERLIDLLVADFDEVIGPVVESGVIRLRAIGSADDLPLGVTDRQEAGTYRLVETGDDRRFGYSVGPDSLKELVHPPASHVWTMRRRDGTLVVDPTLQPIRRTAVVGVRACDLRALDVLGHTQTGDPADPAFRRRRDGLFVVAVDCTEPAPTCFCGSTPGGPIAHAGFDVALIELDEPDRTAVRYVVRAASDRGLGVVDRLRLPEATEDDVLDAGAARQRAARALIRELPADAAEAVRYFDHPRWQDVADRCLTCGNCTAVCPTCFCTDMSDEVGLDGETATRTRVWDTCFSLEYSRLGPSPHRASAMSRYRQWLSHKFGTWHDQFGESGCVGCGRCITWCPVGIDVTAEVEALAGPREVVS